MHCSLFIPDFFSMESASPADRIAAAETLIARGRRRRTVSTSPETWLFERFGAAKQRDWPVAPYTLLADGGAPGQHFWMRADPVHVSIERDRLGLREEFALEVSRAESDALVDALNRHFGESLLFSSPRPERWYVRLPRAPEMETTPPSAVRGTAVGEKLPSGADAMRFHSLMNEAQMLLHEHPVNAEREARGAPAVNSVWFWGGGILAAVTIRPYSAVIGDDPLARGLALAAGIPNRGLPGRAEDLLSLLPREGTALIVLGPPRRREGRAALERDWFEPLLGALESGRIGMLTLQLGGPDSLLEVETVRSDLRHFWRTRKPVESYLA
jgi:hypothetical protein